MLSGRAGGGLDRRHSKVGTKVKKNWPAKTNDGEQMTNAGMVGSGVGGALTNEQRQQLATAMLLKARQTLTPIAQLPAALCPRSMDEAYGLQDAMQRELGAVGGWKVGAATPTSEPAYAPMAYAAVTGSGATIPSGQHRMRGVEAEIAFLLGRDLPVRETPYTRAEIMTAVASCHPAIERLESAFANPDDVPRLSMIGDLQMHGGFVYGAAVDGWEHFDFARETVTLQVDGQTAVASGANTFGGDLLPLVVWLANHAQARTGGLRSGQWITTGSWTGKTLLPPGATAEARFGRFGCARLTFA